MSKYYVDKFLYSVDRDPDLLDAYRKDAKDLVEQWEDDLGPRLLSNRSEESTVVGFTDDERQALINHDYVALFELGAHFFLNLTLFIAVYDEQWTAEKGPLSFQREFGAKLQHWIGRTYPSVAT